jgi:hypothetical protein
MRYVGMELPKSAVINMLVGVVLAMMLEARKSEDEADGNWRDLP